MARKLEVLGIEVERGPARVTFQGAQVIADGAYAPAWMVEILHLKSWRPTASSSEHTLLLKWRFRMVAALVNREDLQRSWMACLALTTSDYAARIDTLRDLLDVHVPGWRDNTILAAQGRRT